MCGCFVMQPTAHLCCFEEINFVKYGSKIRKQGNKFRKLGNRFFFFISWKCRCVVVWLSNQLRIYASPGKIKWVSQGCRRVVVLLCNQPHFYVSLKKDFKSEA